MHATALAILLAIAQVAAIAAGPGAERHCMYQPGVPKPVANPGPGAAPMLVSAQGEAGTDPEARSEAQLNWSRRVQASFGPAFATFGKARNAAFTCRESGSYLSPRRSCSVQAQPCN
jgi:hypothetical protein